MIVLCLFSCKRRSDIVRQYYSTWRNLGPLVNQEAHAIPGGPPGGPLQGNDLFFFCRGMIHEISIYNRQISIWNWKRRFAYVSYQNDQFCVSSYLRIMIYVSLIRRSYCSYLSDWWKMEHQDLVVLHVDSDIAELRYLVCMAQSFELGLVTSFCNVFSLNSASLRYWICWISASVKRWHWNINMVNFSDRVIWLTKWSFHNVFNFSLSSVRWLAALRNLFKGGTKDWSQSNNVWLLYLTISLMELCMLCIALLLLHMQSLSI